MKRRNLWMSLTLMCGSFCLAFTFDSKGIYWIWNDARPGAILLAIASAIFAVLWMNAVHRSRVN